MTSALKERVLAAVQSAGFKVFEGFGALDITAFNACSREEAAVFVSDCGSEAYSEYLSLDGSVRKAVKKRIKLTVFAPVSTAHDCMTPQASPADGTLCAIEEIFSFLSLGDSFSALTLSVSEAKASAAHSRVMREGYISAVCMLTDGNDVREV